MTTTTFRNSTSKGNVAAFHVEVDDQPNAREGKAHARIVNEFRDGRRATATGNYFPTREAADAAAAEWIAKCEANPSLVREQ